MLPFDLVLPSDRLQYFFTVIQGKSTDKIVYFFLLKSSQILRTVSLGLWSYHIQSPWIVFPFFLNFLTGIYYSSRYIQKLSQTLTIIFCLLMSNTETEIFIQQSSEHSRPMNIFEDDTLQSSIPYLKKGDSSLYIGQFLITDEEEQERILLAMQQRVRQSQLFDIQSQSQHTESHGRNDNTSESEHSSDQQHQASVFHNFQKHLTIALRMLVDLSHVDSDKDSIVVAKKLWKVFKQSNVTAKKMLHYILGEKNEHSINVKLLDRYGFREAYEAYPEWLINEAKAFLRIEALNQLKEANLIKYTSKRRIKNQEYFILYVKEFMTQLEEGFLKKRIKKEKVLKD